MKESVGIRRLDFFLLKNILLGLAAASVAFATCFPGFYELNCVLTAAALGSITFAAYQFASWYPVMTMKGLLLHRNPGVLVGLVTSIAGILGVIYLSSRLSLLILPGILTLLYYLRWPSGFLRGGMRSFFIIKNILVGLIWTFITYNIVVVPARPDPVSWTGRFLLVVILTLGLDLRDIESDTQRKVRTIPGHYGFQKAKRAILAFSILVFSVLACLDFPFKQATLISLAISVLVIISLKPQTGYWTYFLLLDGILPLHALLILFLR